MQKEKLDRYNILQTRAAKKTKILKRIFINNSNNSYRSKNKIDSTTKFLI